MARKTNQLAENPDAFEGIDVPIQHQGNAIILPLLPAAMDLRLAAKTLLRKAEEEEQEVSINEMIDAFPLDGAVAFGRAMQAMFGWTSAVPTPGFFGPKPPMTIDVPVGPDESISVVWSRFEIPGVDGFISCDATNTETGPRFVITGVVRRKDQPLIRKLAALTREFVAKESIYRGKAIRIEIDDDGDAKWQNGISFVDLRKIDPRELIFSESTERQIKTNLWSLICHTDACRKSRIPLKRGILLEGKYGTGKTLTSTATAILAVQNGWTFLTINRVSGLEDALHFARKFQPCVIFAEDIDRSVQGEERTVEIDDILNTIDGIGSKNTEIMVVLTTNHIEKINRAMLRPGRLDAIVSVTTPDEQAVRRLIALYGREMLTKGDTFEKSVTALVGQIPAMIREAVERAKLYAIERSRGNSDEPVTDDDIYSAAVGMQSHMALLESPVEGSKEPTMAQFMATAMKGAVENLMEAQQRTQSGLRDVGQKVLGVARKVAEAADSGAQEQVVRQLGRLNDKVDDIRQKVSD